MSKVQDMRPGLVWGSYAWLMLHSVYHPSDIIQGATCSLEMLQLQAARITFSVGEMGQGREKEELAASSCSPCGTFICRYDMAMTEIKINDMRSGEIVLRRTAGPAGQQASGQPFHDVTVRWSSCGRRITIAGAAK